MRKHPNSVRSNCNDTVDSRLYGNGRKIRATDTLFCLALPHIERMTLYVRPSAITK